jgi:hypothetical protein
MESLAEVFCHQERYEEAEKLHQQVLELRVKAWGMEHPLTLKSMKDLADMVDGQGKRKDAGLAEKVEGGDDNGEV